jgi:hypothetical protein
MSKNPPARLQPASSPPPEILHTRVDPPSPSQPPSPKTPKVESADSDRSRQLSEEWQRCADEWQAERKGPKLTRSKGQGLAMKARATDHGPGAITKVIDWAQNSQHDRARFLRDRGLSLKTLMRASNFEEYLGFASQPEPPERARRSGPRDEELLPMERAAKRVWEEQQEQRRTQ